MERVRSLICDVPDFPKTGIVFRDITPVLEDAQAFGRVIQVMASHYADAQITRVAGIESRGFIFGAPLAAALGCGFSLIRKPGKLPRVTHRASYALEYGEDTVEMHQDTMSPSDRVVLIDDLLATGGTAAAAIRLIRCTGATIDSVGVVIELQALGGRERLDGVPVHSLLTY